MIQDGTRGIIPAIDHSRQEPPERDGSTKRYDPVQKRWQRLTPVKGTVNRGIFYPDPGEPITYPIVVNELFEKEFIEKESF